MSRISLLLAALSLLPACAADVLSTTEQKASGDKEYYLAESRRCDPNFCILFTAQDTDHDGVADDDELAAGTDPNDPTKYPPMIALATLMAKHELPTWEAGNSLMVLLPTYDANGLPVFGGGASLPARKSGLETAGIKVPAGIDLGRGFTMSRTFGSNDMSFGQLFTAFGREDKGSLPVRLLADAIGWSPSGQWTITDQDVKTVDGFNQMSGTLEGERTNGDSVTGGWSIDGNTTRFDVSSTDDDGAFQQSVEITKNSDGSISATTVTRTLLRSHTTTLGGKFAQWLIVTTTSTTSADGTKTTRTTHKKWINVEPNQPDQTQEEEETEVCENGECRTLPRPTHSTAEEDHADSDHGYLDPEAAEHSGVITANPDGMSTAIAMLGSNILVVQNDNDPLSNYEVPPTGVHDAWGPIALYGGDPESMYTLGTGFGITPAFVRVPRPEYDPNLSEQKPPMDAPPDRPGCLYCAQPPAPQ